MDCRVSQQSLLHLLLLLLLLLATLVSSAHIPRLGIQRKASPNQPQEDAGTYEELATFYYKQPLDHFNYQPQSYVTFRQRYIIDFKHWEGVDSTAPIFAFLGAEAAIDGDIFFLGLPFQLAARYKAMLVFIEHRFYGESVPLGSVEKAMKNASIRGYLNSAQALADYAQVLLHVKRMFSAKNSPIIVMGGSYGGMLASWFRLKYPHIALGALASSAPILYFDNITPQDGYYSIVSESFKETSKSCYETIRRSWAEIDRIAKGNPEGLSILSKRFKTCNKLNNSSELKDYLDDVFTEAAQYNNPSDNPVRTICMAIDEEAKKTKDVLAQVLAGVIASMGNGSCYDVYEYRRPNDLTDQYSWQVCSEMVMPIGRSGKHELMLPTQPFDLKSFKKSCKSSYGVSPRPHWITTYYGGQDLKLVLERFASNIIFSNGLRDPYSSGGVLHNISQNIVAVTTAKGSHCLDIQAEMADDPDWLIMQRKIEIDIIQGWIDEYNVDLSLFNR